MTIVVYVDGCPKWSVSSLQGAMDLAMPYALEGQQVELLESGARELRAWHFDTDSESWLESHD